MEMLTLIISLSIIMWYIIDRFKEMWEGNKVWQVYHYGCFCSVRICHCIWFWR